MEDVLIWCHRKLGPVARKLGIQRMARKAYEEIAARWYSADRLARVRQNGRMWKLHHDVAERGEFQEFETVEWLRAVVRPGMTVVDVGANVGQMTLEMATLVGPTGRVIAIEPGVGNLKYLRDHLKGNDLLDRVTIIDAACSDEDGGEVTFFVSSVDGDAAAVGSGHNIVGIDAIMKQSTTLKVREQRVARVSLDGLCARLGIQPSVFKIDVEGAELLVLKGARQTLSCGRPAVRVGFHPFAFPDPQAASNELCALADQAGYRLDGVAPGQLLELAEYNWVAK